MSNETQQKVKFHIYENFFSQAYLDLLSLEVIGKEYLKPEQNRLQIALANSSESIENSLSFETENGRVFGNFYDRNNCFNVNSLVSKINKSLYFSPKLHFGTSWLLLQRIINGPFRMKQLAVGISDCSNHVFISIPNQRKLVLRSRR